MKSIISFAMFAGVAFAQRAQIGLPTAGQQLTKGNDVIVQVQRPNSLTGSTELVVAIGISSCGSEPCKPADEVMGTILYNGDFKPEYHESSQPPYQNVTVNIPSSFTEGNAQVNVAHATLMGAGPYPYLEILNQTVVVV
ncbi:hypothetical protein N7462_010496 [Penicillium macrosclerotiorum]|uniref:uncharacterized protein n=1 Tax=Penicillium macrosclerotiorum TaxID=303699 RepID=UPI0025478CCA|nr:uncharacterized protein N7462_010496 [Penicillium macrosclerotiorum]KAJ5669426.1 hypothetical protein N7462_010496 [Penicillium macrosclerotiorum]